MQIDRLPGLYYKENVTYELSGVGSKIPIFIGVTGNTSTSSDKYKTDGTKALKFKSKSAAIRNVVKTGDNWENETGIGVYLNEETGQVVNANNKLARVITEFYEEARLVNSGDIGVPYIYVIDVGDGTNYEHWKNALKTAKSLLDASVEVYVGAKVKTENNTKSVVLPATQEQQIQVEVTTGEGNEATTTTETQTITTEVPLTGFLNTVIEGITTNDDYGLKGSAINLDLRYAFASFEATDDRLSDDELLKTITQTTQYSRVGICEPLLFGKTICRICCTPNNTEPGYYAYRSVEPGTFHKRTKAEMLQLQDAGIIFNNDEHINSNVYPKINLCVSTSFAKNPREADSLFHARFNADSLLRDVFEACYHQIKANESATNIAYLQTRINKLVNDRVTAEEMVKYDEKSAEGTKLIVTNSDADPYRLIVSGQIQPIKCTIAILINATVVM